MLSHRLDSVAVKVSIYLLRTAPVNERLILNQMKVNVLFCTALVIHSSLFVSSHSKKRENELFCNKNNLKREIWFGRKKQITVKWHEENSSDNNLLSRSLHHQISIRNQRVNTFLIRLRSSLSEAAVDMMWMLICLLTATFGTAITIEVKNGTLFASTYS
jgi:hypothetical protein